jgi:hypothetical protein
MPPDSLSLHDPVLVYNDGSKHKIVSLDVLHFYSLIYDKYLDDTDALSDITVAFCPYTCTASIYFGRYSVSDERYHGGTVLKDEQGELVVQIFGKGYSKDTDSLTDGCIRRVGATIMLLLNAISMFPDCQYLHIDPSSLTGFTKPIAQKGDKYNTKYNTKYNRNTLVYVITYVSSDCLVDDDKNVVIVGKYASKKLKFNYDFKLNGFAKYFNSMHDKIQTKLAIITPCYWSAVNNFYKDAKIIKL